MPHRDRPSCEWSMTVNLSQSEPWPIYMDGKEIIQEVGDGALYQGCEVYHWRKPFKGNEYIQVFLHYVDADGPYKDFVDDTHTTRPQMMPFSYKFLRINPNLSKWYKFDQGFTPDESTAIINMFKHKTLVRAQVGEGTTNENVRRSKIIWIPKTHTNDWIYKRMTELINHANNEFFKVEITEILEEIQFTQYDTGDKYDWHVDVGDNELRGGRKLSIVVQLSDPSEYEGGEFQFGPAGDAEIEVADKNKGCTVIFPSFIRHRATEVTKGTRYSLVLWITGPSYR